MKREHPKNCPFCNTVLPIQNGESITWCNNCGSSWIPHCSKCNMPTWMNKRKMCRHSTPTFCKFRGKIE